jgi:acetyl-CoA/propionyl-CoA carboxylase biotin carboxyl carrier protein
MMAKLIVTGPTREIAIRRARRALDEFVLEGVASVLPFHRAVLRDDDFTGEALKVHTQWIETVFAERIPADTLRAEPVEPGITTSWIEIDGRRHTLRMPAGSTPAALPIAAPAGAAPAPESTDAAVASVAGLVAPMAGTLITWLIGDGTEVAEGDPVVVMEAMKMETTIVATGPGTLRHRSAPGDFLAAGEQLATLD